MEDGRKGALALTVRLFPDLIALYRSAYSGAPYFELFTEEEVKHLLVELMGKREIALYVAITKDGEIAGFTWGYGLSPDEEIARQLEGLEELPEELRSAIKGSRAAYIAELAVDSRFRNRGIGTKLVSDIVEDFRRRGFTHVVVRTNVGNIPAKRIYEKLGFVQIPGSAHPVEHERILSGLSVDLRVFFYKEIDIA